MGIDKLSRKLAAIFYADVAGYSRLTGLDEEGTHRRLRDYLQFVSEDIAEHNGNVIHYAGDAVLADFGTVTDALTCARSIQNELHARNADLPEDLKLQFRIGINLGEVIEDQGEIYGDGVNVAARLESLAEPGGICISESVRVAAGTKLAIDYEFMGEREVKNITEPVRAFSVVVDYSGGSAETSTPIAATNDQPARSRSSLAVLPLECMAEDRTLEYLADGLSEDLTTMLARIPGFLVVSRGSAFVYKGKPVDTRQVASDLGVRYLVEGSLRPMGHTIRMTVQLIDAEEDPTSGRSVSTDRPRSCSIYRMRSPGRSSHVSSPNSRGQR